MRRDQPYQAITARPAAFLAFDRQHGQTAAQITQGDSTPYGRDRIRCRQLSAFWLRGIRYGSQDKIRPSAHQKQAGRLLFFFPSTFSLMRGPEPWPQGRLRAAAGGFILAARTVCIATATDRGGSENRLKRPGFSQNETGAGTSLPPIQQAVLGKISIPAQVRTTPKIVGVGTGGVISGIA